MRRQPNMPARVLSMLLALTVLPAVLAVFAFALPPQYDQTFLAGYRVKLDALRDAPGRRVIVAGGSGAAFNVDSELLTDALPGYRAVNLGMYAGLGTTAVLDNARPFLREGDVVVFMPEQSEQTLSLFFGAESMWQAADGRFDLLGGVSAKNAGKMLAAFPYFAAQKAPYYIEGTPPAGDGIYAADVFTPWGDISSPLRVQNVMTGGFDPNTDIAFGDSVPSPDFIEYVNDYAAMCRERGVTFFFAYCPMDAAALDDAGLAAMDAYAQRLAGQLDAPILGDIRDAVMDAAWFYDTNFHLNASGAVAYTAKLAALLQDALGVAGEAIAVPDMPGMPGAQAFTGDDSDAKEFTFEETDRGLRITSLTDRGSTRRRLTVPTHIGGEPVVSLSPETFAGNTSIREITIQPNIALIEDGSFDDCTALERIVMLDMPPSGCSVGSGLLDGTSASVIVPAAMLGSYRTHYFWSMHAARIQPDGETASSGDKQTAVGDGPAIVYDANGGHVLGDEQTTTASAPVSQTHARTNTLQGSLHFVRRGHVITGWNTAPDGSGETIPLGSRVTYAPNLTLYAQWAAETPAERFTWIDAGGEAHITGYAGDDVQIVIPYTLGGMPVRRICAGAFAGAQFDTLVLNPNVFAVEDGAFAGSGVSRVILFDTLFGISDAAFAECPNLAALHINAAADPVYSRSYYATFADKTDRLLSLAGQHKLVLFSGSSTRYGYDSEALLRDFPGWQPANMGVYAYTNALPQMEIIRSMMEPGDVLLHAPEFDTLHTQFCERTALDEHFFAMIEADYALMLRLNARNFTAVFDSLNTYLSLRRGMPALSYEETLNHYDDDGNFYASATYNAYGDYTLKRPNSRDDVLLQHMRANYTVDSFPPERIEAMNAEYRRFLADGITVLFTYTPRNRSSLTEASTPERRAELDALLRDTLCVPVITPIEDSLYSGVYFYIVDSHLSDEGVAIRHKQLVPALAPYLK